jgi:hypothetical protein
LPPKPPPISIGTTFTFEMGCLRMPEVCERMGKEPWVEVQIVS